MVGVIALVGNRSVGFEAIDQLMGKGDVVALPRAILGLSTLAGRRETGLTLPEGVEKSIVRKPSGKI